MFSDAATIARVLIAIVSVAGVLSCLRVLATRLERDRALHALVAKSRALKEHQDKRLAALRTGSNPQEEDNSIETGSIDSFDVEVVDDEVEVVDDEKLPLAA